MLQAFKESVHHKWKLLTDSEYREEHNLFDWFLFLLYPSKDSNRRVMLG